MVRCLAQCRCWCPWFVFFLLHVELIYKIINIILI